MKVDVVDVSSWIPDVDEELGARDKMWMSRSGDLDTPEALWKAGRSASRLAEPCADLWAEVVAARLALLMDVPAARVDLAVNGEDRGVLAWRLEGVLRHGNELLNDLYADYESATKGRVKGYDLKSIRKVLEPYLGWREGLTAFDCFAGLLVFDALISNTDRHHENWAVIEGSRTLAPSYDHGASLGFNVSKKMQWDAAAYAKKGRSRHFPGRPHLVELAHEALGMVEMRTSVEWLDAVNRVDTEDVLRIVHELPHGWMSEPARKFVVELIRENRRRLLL